jgi:hypothetical protein
MARSLTDLESEGLDDSVDRAPLIDFLENCTYKDIIRAIEAGIDLRSP